MGAALMRSVRPGSPLARRLAPVLNPLLPERELHVRVLGGPARGIRIVIEPRLEKYYWTGTHELDVQHALVDLLAPGSTFWDIGAHAGFFSLLAARLVGPGGRVHAFEPLAVNRRRLERSIELNRVGNVVVSGDAMAREPGSAVLRRHASTLMGALASGGDGERVRTTTLDDLARRIGAPDVVKIDAEGREVDVLCGGLRMLAERRTAVVVELNRPELLRDARSIFSSYAFDPLGSEHWLLRPGEAA